MKKIFTVLIIMLLCGVANAGNLSIVSGSKKNIKSGEKAIVEFDFESAAWEEGQDFKSFCGDAYEERVNGMSRRFISTFNQNSSKLTIERDATNCKYKIKVVADNFERKASGWGWGRFHIRWYGTISIIDLESNTEVCKIKGSKVSGDNDYVPLDRLIGCYRELAEQLAAFIGK